MNNYNNFNGKNFNPISEYPYGELPLKYTKQGQSKLREELKNRNYVSDMQNASNVQVESTNNSFFNSVSTQNNNNNSSNSSLDVLSLLPLLIGLSGNNNSNLDVINKLMPLINGNSKPDMQTLLKLFGEFNKKSTSVSSTSTNNKNNDIVIDNLKKVD